MTRIGIDARLLRSFGMGTYVRGLLRALAELEGEEKYVVFATTEDRDLVPALFDVVEANVRLYTIRESTPDHRRIWPRRAALYAGSIALVMPSFMEGYSEAAAMASAFAGPYEQACH